MFRKNYFFIILTFATLLAGSIAVFAQAQTQTISGQVEVKKADGTTAPSVGADVVVYRVDQKGSYTPVKTDEKGEFLVSGIPNEGEYVISISGEKINPEVSQSIAPGSKALLFTVSPGDGKKYTEDQIRQAISKSNELTPEQKKEREAIESSNKKVTESNVVINKALTEGKTAFDSKNYDVAIAKFDEGFNASPDYVGSAPVFLNNKAASLLNRALVNYNKSAQSKDAAEKAELLPKAKKDFEDSINTYNQSFDLLKAAKPDETAKIQKAFDTTKEQALAGAQDAVRLMIRTGLISEEKKDDVAKLMHEYVAAEKDQKKKEDAQAQLALYLLRANDFDNSIVEYRKAVEISPSNPDAVGGLGLTLWTVTYGGEDKAKKQEALNYMQYFLDTAPQDHPLRDGIESGVADLKSQKLTPQKISKK